MVTRSFEEFVALFERRIGILYAVALVTFLFSPFILNDVVVIILTQVVVRYAKQFSVDVAPLLVAEITFTNMASSFTPLGNPQNILLWSASHVTVVQFVSGTWLPVATSATIASLMLFPLSTQPWRQRISLACGVYSPAIYLALVAIPIRLSDLAGIEPYVSLVVFRDGRVTGGEFSQTSLFNP